MAPQKTIKMLVLETDETHPKTQHERGSFGDIFNSVFTSAGEEHDPPLGIETDMHFIVNDPSQDFHGHVPKASEIGDDIKAILITGSMYDAHGDDPWILELLALLKELWTTRSDIKFSGVCFGHQLLNRFLGGTVEQHPGEKWELSHTSMDLSPIGQKLFRTNDSQLALHQMHQDRVTVLPSHERSNGLLEKDTKVHIWASSSHTKVQGVYIRDKIFTSQGHLGFDDKMVHRQIELRKKSGAIDAGDDDVVQEAKEKAHLEHDGKVVAAAILRFFHGDDHDID